MVAPTCFGITLPPLGSVPSAFWEMFNWGAVDRIMCIGVLCLVTWCHLLQIPQWWKEIHSIQASVVEVQNVQPHVKVHIHDHADYTIPQPSTIFETVPSIYGVCTLKPRTNLTYWAMVQHSHATVSTVSVSTVSVSAVSFLRGSPRPKKRSKCSHT
jgi:hypothetical protein